MYGRMVRKFEFETYQIRKELVVCTLRKENKGKANYFQPIIILTFNENEKYW